MQYFASLGYARVPAANQRLKPPGAAFLGLEKSDQMVYRPADIDLCALGRIARNLSAMHWTIANGHTTSLTPRAKWSASPCSWMDRISSVP